MNIENLLNLKQDYALLPITIEFKDTNFDALSIMREFQIAGKPSLMMTGKPKQNEDGYTFICVDPEASYTYRNGKLTIDNFTGDLKTTATPLHPFVENLLEQNRTPRLAGLPPFTGGVVGYFGYDYSRYATTASITQVTDPHELADADLMLVKTVVAYNHTSQQVTIIKLVNASRVEELFEKTTAELNKFKQRIMSPTTQIPIKAPELSPLKLQFSLAEFSKKVAATKQHIVDGDIFQLILSNPHMATIKGSLLGSARRFFNQNPSPYQFYFHHDDFESVGASPETLITKRQESLFSYPLAGTRRRGKTAAEDQQLAKELQTSEKELSEHNMLIDLGRNDLGRVSEFGSVNVISARNLLKFSSVMHLGSVIESQAAKDITAMDIVDSVLPAGTLSGAPKVSAMQIIAKLENNKRGIYGGGIGYLGFNGDLDLCIGIRLAYRKGNHLIIHSGAGIVADSVAKYEYQEFNNKARGVINSLYPVSEEENAHEFSN
ncbi:anthranilate synthase component I [Lentilactobacillus curieae]|uniref:Anthranilate synthase component 1 n=1 Tax=Lentilactobacillus curieae TaxID=1138822 RepID=A0A1S6QHU0_9LACO|nr:anthranilate synthase component I family protein [Lentilactobacillus curieae]AQW21170.1 anthranilate synthase component I [Lentilactobacillus curieae]